MEKRLPSTGKKEYKQKLLVLCNLNWLYVAFKEKIPMLKYGSSNFVLSIQSEVSLLDQQVHTQYLYVVFTKMLLSVDAINWGISYKDLIKKVVCNPLTKECMMNQCNNCPGIDALH